MSAVNISSQAFADLSHQISENAERLKQRNAQKYAIYQQNSHNEAETLRPNKEATLPIYRLREKPASLHNYAQTYLGPDAVYSLHSLNKFQTAAGIKQYADSIYEIAANLNEDAPVLIDFMHKNNRKFDFKI